MQMTGTICVASSETNERETEFTLIHSIYGQTYDESEWFYK